MIKFETNHGETKTEVNGTCVEILIDTTIFIREVYKAFNKNGKEAGELFKDYCVSDNGLTHAAFGLFGSSESDMLNPEGVEEREETARRLTDIVSILLKGKPVETP